MIVCLDVDYRAAETVTACVGLGAFADDTPLFELTRTVAEPPLDYEPGRFYLREMPHLFGALQKVVETHGLPEIVVVDGYVWLARDRPGLGAHFHELVASALGASLVVIGVAKTAFQGNDVAVAVSRGRSSRPLYVTTVGCDVAWAASQVSSMRGEHRLPTILKRVDRLARDS